MRTIVVSLVVALLISPAWAGCPISGVVQTTDGVTVTVTNVGDVTIQYATDLPSGSATKRATALQDLLQAVFDVRTPVIGLPSDDPDKLVDPQFGEVMFWGDSVGKKKTQLLPIQETYLISRNCVVSVTAVTKDEFDFKFSAP